MLQEIGSGVQDMIGAIYERGFVADLGTGNLALRIRTSRHPFGAANEDGGPAQELIKEIQALFSKDEKISSQESLKILNKKLTVFLAAASGDFERNWERADKITKNDAEGRQFILFAAANMTLHDHRQNYTCVEDVLAAAPKHRAELERALRVLSQSNDDIKVEIHRHDWQPTIYIHGEGLPKAIEKLHTAQKVISDMDACLLHGYLTDWIKANRQLPEFSRTVGTMMRRLAQLGGFAPQPFRPAAGGAVLALQ